MKKKIELSVWDRHIARLEFEKKIAARRAQLERFNQWCLDHPWKARLLALGWAILVGEIAMLIRCGLDRLAGSRP